MAGRRALCLNREMSFLQLLLHVRSKSRRYFDILKNVHYCFYRRAISVKTCYEKITLQILYPILPLCKFYICLYVLKKSDLVIVRNMFNAAVLHKSESVSDKGAEPFFFNGDKCLAHRGQYLYFCNRSGHTQY